MHLYFVRHGETQMNKKGAYYGTLDVPLTPLGHEQAARIGMYLKNITFDLVYISDKKRALETAAHIAPSKAYHIMPELSELDFGCFEGLTNRQVQERFPKLYGQWCQDWLEAVPHGPESFLDFFARVRSGFEKLLEEAGALESSQGEGKNVLVCAHNGTLRVIFALMCGLDARGTWHFNFEQDTYSKADYEWGNFTIRTINCKSTE